MKRFILIDCENIGTLIPKKTITDSQIVYFINGENYKNVLKQKIKEVFGTVPNFISFFDISCYQHKKDCMDMCIVRKVLDILLEENNSKIYVYSKDKGYEHFIIYANNKAKSNVKRVENIQALENIIFECSKANNENNDNSYNIENIESKNSNKSKHNTVDFNKIPKCVRKRIISQQIISKIQNSTTMEELNKLLTKSEKKSIKFYDYTNNVISDSIAVQYDFYNDIFYVLICGKKAYQSKDLNKCVKKASQSKKDYEKRYSIYKNQKNYKIIKELNVDQIIENGVLKNKISKKYLEKKINNKTVLNKVSSLIFN